MANHSHKRDTNARLFFRPRRATTVAGPLAFLATAAVVSLGVANAELGPGTAADPGVDGAVTGPTAGAQTQRALDLAGGLDASRLKISRGGGDRADRADRADKRSTERAPSKVEQLLDRDAKLAAIAGADTKRWTTEALNLWTEPGDKARKTGELAAGKVVVLTGRQLYGRVEIVWGSKQTRWVTAGYTTEDKPFVIGASCTNGTTVPDAVSENIKKVHAAVCAAFPDISTYGTFRGDGEHSQGIAVDIMVSGAEGQRVADFVRAHYAELGVSYVIYSQHIWSVQRSGEGWRAMADRGSITANHYDHVHVTVY